MLLRFVCENFLSFGTEIDFNLTAASIETQHPNHARQPVKSRKEQVLRVAAIYGANASGKSNLVKALGFARSLIANGTQLNRPIPGLMPFKLRKNAGSQPSRFEFLVAVEGRLYEYGFVVNRERVLEEWLFDQTTSREKVIFEREVGEEGRSRVKFGGSLAKRDTKKAHLLEFIAEGTRANQLLLREGVERNVGEFRSLYTWFDESLYLMAPEDHNHALTSMLYEDRGFREFAKRFLASVDTGVEGLRIRKRPFDPVIDLADAPERVRQDMMKKPLLAGETVILGRYPSLQLVTPDEGGVPAVFTLSFLHTLPGISDVYAEFSPEEVSTGTLRLTDFLPFVYLALTAQNSNLTWVVDELDSSLHPLLTRRLVEFFLNHTSSDSQLIFTTHETHLLDLDLLRRDEIWFFEKDKDQSSRLSSLVEYKPRKDLRIEKGYLQGRFGAIPFLGNPSWLESPDAVQPEPAVTAAVSEVKK